MRPKTHKRVYSQVVELWPHHLPPISHHRLQIPRFFPSNPLLRPSSPNAQTHQFSNLFGSKFNYIPQPDYPNFRHQSRMVSPENTNWFIDYGLIDDIPVPDANFQVSSSGFNWPVQTLNGSSSVRFPILRSLPNYKF